MGFLLLAAASFLSGSGCKLFRAGALSLSVPQSHVSTRSHPQCRRGRKRVLLTPQPASPGRRNHLSWAPTSQVRETICRAKKFSPSIGYLEWLLVYALKPGKLQYVQPQETNDTTSFLTTHWTGNKSGCHWLEKVDASLRIEGFTHDSQPGPQLRKGSVWEGENQHSASDELNSQAGVSGSVI